MKKRMLCLMLPASLLLGACSSDDKKTESSDTGKSRERAVEEAPADTTPGVYNIPFEVKKYEKEKGDNELDMEYPISGNPELLDSVRNWMSEMLTATYHGNLDDSDAFFTHYAAQLGEDPDLNEWGGYTKDDFKVDFVNDFVVTYAYTSYIYEGGAHGLGGTYGISFLQSDGSIFGKDCITSYAAIHQLIIDGLKRYFKVESDIELRECLHSDVTLARLSPPGMNPWVDRDGVAFSYTPYEIAPYSAGSPHFTIPLEQIEPYLTPRGKLYFGIEKTEN